MFQLIKIAYRDLNSNRRRSLLTALAIGLGVGLLVIMSGIIEGEIQDSLDASIRLQSGHLQIRDASFKEDRLSLIWDDLLPDSQAWIERLQNNNEVQVATPILWSSGIISIHAESANVKVSGIDPMSLAYSPFRNGLVAGEFITSDDRNGILIGKRLADSLGITAGQEVNLVVSTSNGEPDEARFTIRGVYNTGFPGIDETTIFMPLSKAQAFTRTEGHVSTIFVLLKDRAMADAIAETLRTAEVSFLTWRKFNELMLQTMNMADTYIYIFYLIVLAVAATVIVNTLLMAVFERTREIGILAAIGMKSREIMAMFLLQAGLLGIAGTLFGIVIGTLGVAYFVKNGIFIGDIGTTGMLFGERIYARFTINETIYISLIGLVTTLLAGFYPASLAARMEPTEALRSD
jgi:ABC-type lipoprotein release transport system permease subunit